MWGVMGDTLEIKTKPRGCHPQKKLTAVSIRNARKAGRYADGNGLYLVVDPSGAKRWIQRIVVRGKRTDLGLGGLGVVDLAKARDEAQRLRGLARRGVDIMAERRAPRVEVPTFEEAARKVHEQHAPTFRNAKHKSQWLTSLATYAFPVFGTRRVDTIVSGDVLRALTPIWTDKRETASRVKQRIGVVFDWAKASGYRTGDNPTEGLSQVLPKTRAEKKHHAALPYKSVAPFLRRVRSEDAREPVRLAFEFAVLTAARTGEVLGAKWTEIDLDEKTWTIPAERMKAHEEHRVPLSRRALEILRKAKEVSEDKEYVFSIRAKAPLSNMVFLMLLRRMGRKDITAHGFRSSFRDWAAERTNTPRAVCEAALAHTLGNKTEAAYKRTDLFERRRKLMESWAAFATSTTADVIAMSA